MHAMPTPRLLGRILFVNVSILFVLLFNFTNANGYFDKIELNPDAYSVAELQMVIEEYQTQVNVVDKQIQDVEKDLDWLILKINRMSDSGRKVPRQLKLSVPSKKEKVALLGKQKSRLMKAISGYEKAYRAKIQMAERKRSESKVKLASITPVTTADEVPDGSSKQGKIPDIELAVKKAGLEDWVQVLNGDGGCAKINNTLPILFSSGSASLAKEYKNFFKKLAHFLRPYDVKVYVNGFADPDPIHTPKYSSNFELGASRAANIVHEMVRYGLKPEIFKIGTTGEYRFAAKEPFQKKSFQRRALVTVVFSG